jgi:ribosomal protein S18 acetylase RimI-like enzyme
MKPKLSYRGFSTTKTSATLLNDGISTTKQSLMADTATPAKLPPPQISKTDTQFADEGVEFVWGIENLPYEELNDLFQRVGFPRRDPEKLAMALGNTYSCIWIRASRKSRMAKEGQMLGFARATSDGALSATIWDVAVNPAWQRGGLGRGLVERLTEDLVEHGISTITLYAEPGVVGLYEKLGFVKDPQGVKGLAFQSASKKGKAVKRGAFLAGFLPKPINPAAVGGVRK